MEHIRTDLASLANEEGRHLFDQDRRILYELAERPHLWSQRVSLIATFYFIRKNQFADSMAVAEVLLSHQHHLIYKVIGWVLREISKCDLDVMEEFLHLHIQRMSRTSLRYAIEHLPPLQRHYKLTLH